MRAIEYYGNVVAVAIVLIVVAVVFIHIIYVYFSYIKINFKPCALVLFACLKARKEFYIHFFCTYSMHILHSNQTSIHLSIH